VPVPVSCGPRLFHGISASANVLSDLLYCLDSKAHFAKLLMARTKFRTDSNRHRRVKQDLKPKVKPSCALPEFSSGRVYLAAEFENTGLDFANTCRFIPACFSSTALAQAVERCAAALGSNSGRCCCHRPYWRLIQCLRIFGAEVRFLLSCGRRLRRSVVS